MVNICYSNNITHKYFYLSTLLAVPYAGVRFGHTHGICHPLASPGWTTATPETAQTVLGLV